MLFLYDGHCNLLYVLTYYKQVLSHDDRLPGVFILKNRGWIRSCSDRNCMNEYFYGIVGGGMTAAAAAESIGYYFRGILLWNTWGRVDAARSLIARPGPFTASTINQPLPV